MCFSLWDIRMLQNKELGNLTHRFRMKLGVWETFLWWFFVVAFLVVFQILFQKSFLVCFQAVNSDSFFFKGYASTPILFLFTFSFLLLRGGQSRFLFEKLGAIKFYCFEIVIKSNGQNSCFYFGNINIASNSMFPILFCCSDPLIISVLSELRILSN